MQRAKTLNQILWTFNTIATIAILALTFQFFVSPQPAPDLTKLKGWKPQTAGLAGFNGPRADRYRAFSDLQLPVRPQLGPPRPAAGAQAPPAFVSTLITLNGIFLSGNPADSSAVITENASKKTLLYGVGQVIGSTGAVIKEIQADHILVEIGGRIERVSVKEAPSTVGTPGAAPVRPPFGGGPPPLPPPPAGSPNSPGGAKPAGSSGMPNPAEGRLQAFRTHQDPANPNRWIFDPLEQKAMVNSFAELRNEVGIRPVIDSTSGTVRGVQVESIAPSSMLRNRGVQPGDIVRKVNGIAITSQDQTNDLMNDPRIRNATRLDVEVERQGQTIHLQYEVGQ